MPHFLILILILITSLGTAPAHATDSVQLDYMLNCQGCHLPDGAGFAKRNVPRIRGHIAKYLQVVGGREFLIQVPGSAQSDLSDERLARVINWMLIRFSAKELPFDFRPYRAAEVGVLRRTPLIDVKVVRARLLERIARWEAKQTINAARAIP